MGKIILNDIEYGIGVSNGSNVDTTNLVKKDSIVTVIDDTCTDEQVPSAKAVHTAIQNVSGGTGGGVIIDDVSISMGRKSDTTIGDYSTALGNNVEASGSYSHAEGNGTNATNQYAHAEGRAT